MKSTNQDHTTLSLSSCGVLLQKVEQARQNLTREFAGKLREHEPMLHLALNEAESLAFQTPFPHLFFPTLAEEKAGALVRWASRQQRLSHSLVAA